MIAVINVNNFEKQFGCTFVTSAGTTGKLNKIFSENDLLMMILRRAKSLIPILLIALYLLVAKSGMAQLCHLSRLLHRQCEPCRASSEMVVAVCGEKKIDINDL